jgi:membrane fusion protein (multidrug efflux system)
LRLLVSSRRLGLAASLFAFPALFASTAFAAAPPPAVTVTPVTEQNIAPSFSNIGHVIAINSVNVTPRVTAYIDRINVKEGSDVKAGQVLFTLQTAQYDAALETAEANLAAAKAALENAQLEYQRASSLRSTGFEAQSALDTAIATRNEDQANVLAGEAGVANAQLNLSYCTIVSPLDGRIGFIPPSVGDLVTPTTGTIATINQLDPIRVEFAVPSSSPILAAAIRAQNGPLGSKFSISIDLPDGQPYPPTGHIVFLDNEVDTSTGTVNVYADFPNPNGALLPGAYVNVNTAPAHPQEALLVPVTAVQIDQDGQFVLVVDQAHKVTQDPVTVGDQIAQNYVVRSGLKAGEMVIVDGIQKVKVGNKVSETVVPGATMSADDSTSQ